MATATLKNIDAFNQQAEEITTKYKNGLSYHKQSGYQLEWPMYERFKSSDQWPAATEKTKNLPRPVFNIIDLIESLKVSTVMNEQIMMHFSPSDSGNENVIEAGAMFSKYSETVWEQIDQNELNEEMLDICSNIGTGILHYYWDSNHSGGNTVKYQGKLCGEVLDPINVFFGNPQQKDAQKQPYIVISYRDMLESVKREATASGFSKALVGMIGNNQDKRDEGYDAAQLEVQGSEKTTVLLYYYRKGDNIFYKKVASGMLIKPETDTGMKLYPLAVMQWKRRRKSIHGIGDTKGLIPNQRSINFLVAMAILSAQLTGWPKLAIDPLRVAKSKITNTPGEIVEVKNGEKGLDSAIKFINPGQISGNVTNLVDQIIDMTKSMTSANDSATGEAPGANMSAAAINLLQRQNGVPIEGVKRRFYQCIKDVGRIWEEFFKVKYNLPREVKVKDDDGVEVNLPFQGSDYKDADLDLKIDIGPASMYSEAMMMSSLDKFLDNKYISFLQYLKFAPNNVVPFKDRLIKDVEKQQAEQMAQANADPIASLPPEMQEKFKKLPPEAQQEVLKQLQQAQEGQQGGLPNGSMGN